MRVTTNHMIQTQNESTLMNTSQISLVSWSWTFAFVVFPSQLKELRTLSQLYKNK